MRMSIYYDTFKSVILESVKIKIFSKNFKMIQISENDTFESVIVKSVKIESVRVDRHPHGIMSEKTLDFYLVI